MASQRVPVYAATELKSTTDDAITPFLTSSRSPQTFIASNTKSNVRLALGYAAVTIAGVSFYVDWKHGWQATQPWILAAVVSYFVLNAALTGWIWLVEAGQVFEGKNKQGGETLRLRSSSKKHSAIYTLHILCTAASGKVLQEKSVSGSYTQWFSGDGVFHPEPFRKWLTSEIDVLRVKGEKSG